LNAADIRANRYSPSKASAGLISALLGACMAAAASAADASAAPSTMQGTLRPLDVAQFQPDDDVKCLSDVLEAGDPARGPSTILLKATPGCVVPWHYHTSGEQVVVIRGRLKMEMTGHSATSMGPGGFAAMPGKMAHQFVCTGKRECLLTVMFDGAYDIFWLSRPRLK
jgi:quercetin dioxygenase-like cupin family protein